MYDNEENKYENEELSQNVNNVTEEINQPEPEETVEPETVQEPEAAQEPEPVQEPQQTMSRPHVAAEAQNSQAPKKNGSGPIVIMLIIVLVGAFVCLLGAAAYIVMNRNEKTGNFLEKMEQSNDEEAGEESKNTETYDSTKVYEASKGLYVTDVSDVVNQNMSSVVAITSTTIVESGDYYDIYDFYFGGNGNDGGKQEQQAAGSGIIIKQTDKELLIVTNNHVVEDADKLKIQFNGMSDEDEGVDGYVKGTNSTSDVAVVAVKKEDIPKNAEIKVATIGDSDSLEVGDGVVAIGNALGYGQSVTTGIISAKDRKVELDNGTMTLLQTDAAINGGNSGGALLNSRGEVIGINVAKYSSNGSTAASIEGMGFAIPISSVKDIIGDLETMETRQKVAEEERGYLGINGSDVSEQDAEFYNIPIGVIVTGVTDESPAGKAGIAVRDIITELDGKEIKSMSELQKTLEYYKAGEEVKVAIKKSTGNGYEDKVVTVKLGDKSVLGR